MTTKQTAERLLNELRHLQTKVANAHEDVRMAMHRAETASEALRQVEERATAILVHARDIWEASE